MGDGPYYTLYRPYHLCDVETPVSVAEAVIYGESTIVSKRMVSEVATIAKRDLKPGEIVGEIGSPDIFGRTYTYEEAQPQKAIPLGLAPGGKVLEAIAKGEMLTEENFAPDSDQVCVQAAEGAGRPADRWKPRAAKLPRSVREEAKVKETMKAVVVRAPMEFGVEDVPVPECPRGWFPAEGDRLRLCAARTCGPCAAATAK